MTEPEKRGSISLKRERARIGKQNYSIFCRDQKESPVARSGRGNLVKRGRILDEGGGFSSIGFLAQ